MYEAGRAERMRGRKPRYARYELERMSIKELVALNTFGRAMGIGEKKDLIQHLIETSQIVLIPAPEPVEYKLGDLRSMKVSKLKQAMKEAGVFFHERDVVEKSDMIAIFINSGRLNLTGDVIPEEEPEIKVPNSASTSNMDSSESEVSSPPLRSNLPFVETVDDCPEDVEEKRRGTPGVAMFPSVEGSVSSRSKSETPIVMFPSVTSPDASNLVASSPLRPDLEPVTVPKESSIDSTKTEEPQRDSTRDDDDVVPREARDYNHEMAEPLDRTGSAFPPLNDGCEAPLLPCAGMPGRDVDVDVDSSYSDMSIDEMELPKQSIPEAVTPESLTDPIDSRNTTALSEDNPATDEAQDTPEKSPTLASDNTTQAVTSHSHVSDCPLGDYTVAQLLRLGHEANVDLSACFERSEMVNLLVAAGVTGRSRVDLLPSSFADWSISQLRAIASEVNIDISNCSDHSEIVRQILHEANTERRHLQNYLRVLSPLTTSSLSQLRATARHWDVDISDCLEKDEIIQRLITRANRFGIC